MKPTTKLQMRVMDLQRFLDKITPEHEEWAKQMFNAYCVKHYSNIVCLECNHSWKFDQTIHTQNQVLGEHYECPSCKSKLEWIKTNEKGFSKYDYFAIVDTLYEFQVIRYFLVYKYMNKKGKPTYSIREVFQNWDNLEKITLVGYARKFSYYGDGWGWGNFDIKKQARYSYYGGNNYEIAVDSTYPGARVKEEYSKYGFNGDFHGCAPYALLNRIKNGNDMNAETLLKLNKSHLLAYYFHKSESDIRRNWNQLKICFRHNYEIDDFSIYKDYIEMLRNLRLDINNPKFICPEDLDEAHNWAMAKWGRVKAKRDRALVEEANIERQRIAEEMGIKKEAFGEFFIKDKTYLVKALCTENEYLEEGLKLKHCVHKQDYHLKPDSLILSARIGNEPIETIEVSLSKMQIMQARGWDNKPTEHHNNIIRLVQKNLEKIRKITQKQTKKVA